MIGSVFLDYRGYRVTAQSIIPGILERNQEQSVVNRSVDFGKTLVTHAKICFKKHVTNGIFRLTRLSMTS